MIPLPRHLSTDNPRQLPHAPPVHPLRVARAADSSIPVGSYNPSELPSPTATTEFSERPLSPEWDLSGTSGQFDTSMPAGRYDMALAEQSGVANSPRGRFWYSPCCCSISFISMLSLCVELAFLFDGIVK